MIHGTRDTYRLLKCRCCPCRAANAAYWRSWWQDKAHGTRRLGSLISATTARRRIRQLKAEGYTNASIARALGLKTGRLKLQTRVITVRKHLSIQRLARLYLSEAADQSEPS